MNSKTRTSLWLCLVAMLMAFAFQATVWAQTYPIFIAPGVNPSISADGQIVTYENANGNSVFVYDMSTGVETSLGNGSYATISANGRYVAFNLASGSISVYDRVNNTFESIGPTEHMTVVSTAQNPSISADGRYIAFACLTLNGNSSVKVIDRTTSTILDLGTGGHPFISGNGQYVAYTSDTLTGPANLMLYNIGNRQTKLISDKAFQPSLSSDGRYIAYSRAETGFCPWDVFIQDQNNGNTELIGYSSGRPSISADGRYVAYISSDSDEAVFNCLPANGGLGNPRTISVYDRASKTTSVVTMANVITLAKPLSISSNGQYIVYLSDLDSQPAIDTGIQDVFVTANPLYVTSGSNHPPKADAGMNQTVHVSTQDVMVTLDGSKSADIDKDYPLAYRWAFVSVPDGSSPVMNDATTVSPTFSAPTGVLGDYVISLVVTDNKGLVSDAATVTVTTSDSPPIADAGKDQKIHQVGTAVILDGNKSYDPDGDPICYSWGFDSVPSGSTAVLSNESAENPTFVADIEGDYVVHLYVSTPDSQGVCYGYWGYRGTPQTDTVTISFSKLKSKASASGNQAVVVGSQVSLTGSGEGDPDGSPLAYGWSIVSQPAGSTATLTSTGTPETGFTADVPGQYVASLVVSDGITDSDPSNVTVTVITYQDAATNAITSAIDAVNAVLDNLFNNPNNRGVLTNKLGAVLMSINAGKYDAALNQLENDVLPKTNGCAMTGTTDNDDWIKAPGKNPGAAETQAACVAQGQVYPIVMGAIGYLQNLQ